MNQQQYIAERIDDQIKWYNAKSRASKKSYRTLRVLGVAIALSVPILSSFLDGGNAPYLKFVIAIAGAAVALVEALLSLYKFRDNWTNYRAAAEALIQHKYLFSTQTAPYNVTRPFVLFVQNAENIMAGERVAWVQNNKAEEEKLQVEKDEKEEQKSVADAAPVAPTASEQPVPSQSGSETTEATESTGNEMSTELVPAEPLGSSSSEESSEAAAPNSKSSAT